MLIIKLNQKIFDDPIHLNISPIVSVISIRIFLSSKRHILGVKNVNKSCKKRTEYAMCINDMSAMGNCRHDPINTNKYFASSKCCRIYDIYH